MKRMSDINPELPLEDDSDTIENYSDLPNGISVYEIGGPLFFASARQYAQTITTVGFSSNILIIRMRHVPFIDSTALHNLKETIKSLRDTGIIIIMSGTNNGVYNDLKEHDIISIIKEENIFKKFSDAVEHANILIEEIKIENKK